MCASVTGQHRQKHRPKNVALAWRVRTREMHRTACNPTVKQAALLQILDENGNWPSGVTVAEYGAILRLVYRRLEVDFVPSGALACLSFALVSGCSRFKYPQSGQLRHRQLQELDPLVALPKPNVCRDDGDFPASSARLGTMPASIGAAKTPTIGIVVVVALKSRVRFVLQAMIGSGLRTTTSRAKSG